MNRKPCLIPGLIIALMLFVAVAPLPYGYYQVLRWFTCAVSVFIAVKSYQWKKIWAVWFFGAIAVLFNPIFPIHLTKEIWRPIDVVSAVLFSISAFTLKKPLNN